MNQHYIYKNRRKIKLLFFHLNKKYYFCNEIKNITIMNKPMTCKELAEILLKTPDKPVMITKTICNGDLDGGVWTNNYKVYLNKQYVKTTTLKDGTEAIVLDDDLWA